MEVHVEGASVSHMMRRRSKETWHEMDCLSAGVSAAHGVQRKTEEAMFLFKGVKRDELHNAKQKKRMQGTTVFGWLPRSCCDQLFFCLWMSFSDLVRGTRNCQGTNPGSLVQSQPETTEQKHTAKHLDIRTEIYSQLSNR